jgi:integrase
MKLACDLDVVGRSQLDARAEFDHNRLRVTIFTRGGKIRALPIPHQPFWHDLERLILDLEAKPSDFLMARQKTIPRAGVRRFPDKPMSPHGLHSWWYRCLAGAGIVPEGTQSGERMHKARHTAGQRVLDRTGNLKATQKLLGHASIQTTGDVDADWDIDQLARTWSTCWRTTMSKLFPPWARRVPPKTPANRRGIGAGPVETAGIEPASAVAR